MIHELWYIWVAYFWSSLKGNGPEALVQTVVYAAIAFAVYPPLRHAIEKWVTKHKNEVMVHVSEENKFLHEKLDHVIRHSPDVPEFKGKK